jgi:hypothetical protein
VFFAFQSVRVLGLFEESFGQESKIFGSERAC